MVSCEVERRTVPRSVLQRMDLVDVSGIAWLVVGIIYDWDVYVFTDLDLFTVVILNLSFNRNHCA